MEVKTKSEIVHIKNGAGWAGGIFSDTVRTKIRPPSQTGVAKDDTGPHWPFFIPTGPVSIGYRPEPE